MPTPGGSTGLARAAGAGAFALLWLLALGRPARATEPGGGCEPRLVLPGGHVVRAGQWIEIRWSAAEDVSELELLLSADGGRHYSLCSAPRLDPRRHGVRWRVPGGSNGSLRLRIRFNRDGREIEGAPIAALTVDAPAGEGTEPLALPPLASGGPARDPGCGGERGGPATGAPAADPARPVGGLLLATRPRPVRGGGDSRSARTAWRARGGRDRFLPPRALPLRT